MSRLLSPFQIGALQLKHRVVMAPLTRSRSEQPGGFPGDLMLEYYAQRASDGGLIIGEGSPVSASARGWYGAPGMYSEAQVAGWRHVTDAVHAKGGFMFAQLWHTGRSSHVLVTEGPAPVSASVDPGYWEDPGHLTSTPSGWVQPSPHRALEISEIAGIVEDFRRAAANAKQAGFDGVELHGANGYLIDQFLQDGSNKRTDRYGGSAENRVRLLLEIVAAVADVFGADRVGVRIGPSGRWNGMSDSDPATLFGHLAERLNGLGLAYLHIVEPRVVGNIVKVEGQAPVATQHLRSIFKGPIIAAGGFEPDSAAAIVEAGTADLVAFGRYFLSNPDLPERIARGLPLSGYDRDTFYTFDAKGYTDYPRSAASELQWAVHITPRIPIVMAEQPPIGGETYFQVTAQTLIYGQHDAVLIDACLTTEQAVALADWVALKNRNLTTIYITHGHGDHWFGVGALLERFPGARLVATPETIAVMSANASQRALDGSWRPGFPGQIPESLVIAEPLAGNIIALEGRDLVIVPLGHTDTDETTCVHVPSIGLVVAGDAAYNGVHLYLAESTAETRLEWMGALDKIEALRPLAVVASHKRPENEDSPNIIEETRTYIRDFDRLVPTTKTARELFDAMLGIYPDRVNPGWALWSSALAAKPQQPA